MSLNGTNKKCQQCLQSCKQWAQNVIMSCPHFQSNQKKYFQTPSAMGETTGMTSGARFFKGEHNP